MVATVLHRIIEMFPLGWNAGSIYQVRCEFVAGNRANLVHNFGCLRKTIRSIFGVPIVAPASLAND